MHRRSRDDIVAMGRLVVALARARAELADGRMDAADSLRRLARAIHADAAARQLAGAADAAATLSAAADRDVPRCTDALLGELHAAGIDDDAAPSRILVVEDDPALITILERTIAGPGRAITYAKTVAQATAALDGGAPDLVLLDLVLPDGDGRNFLMLLRERAPTADSMVVVMSSLRSPHLRAECAALGADAFLEKPVDLQVLLATVSTLLERKATAPVSTRQASRRVLVAEDDPVIAALVKHRLSREGFEVVHAADGLHALAQAAEGAYAVAILDVNMPGLSGFALLERLRAMPTFELVPIVMLTAMGNESDIERALALGANDYMLKPFSPVELLARVRRLVAK